MASGLPVEVVYFRVTHAGHEVGGLSVSCSSHGGEDNIQGTAVRVSGQTRDLRMWRGVCGTFFSNRAALAKLM